MARIRSIKPEFQQSQSMGRVSRDARLCFILLWPQCDDSGRIRANSRMLASILFPYDLDVHDKIDSWLAELENEGCIVRYQHDGNDYLAVCHFEHQKIDHPKASKLPAPPTKKKTKSKASSRDTSRPLETPRDDSPLDQGEDQGLDQGGDGIIARSADADDCTLALEAFREVAEELSWPVPQKLTKSRAAALKRRLADCGGIDGWRTAMAKARASPFLSGETPRQRAHQNWTPDLDFFLQESSFTKLMEGKYDGRSTGIGTGSVHDEWASGVLAAAAELRARGDG